jgi:flagellar biosynthesis/type III secretory pathway protein FliH
MNGIKKAIRLAVVFALLISTSTAIVEHIKQETVERMKGKPPLQLNGSGKEAFENISIVLEQLSDGIMPIQPYAGLESNMSAPKNESQELSLSAEPLEYDKIFEKGYQEGYPTGYKQGCMDAYQWMISRIQEQMEVLGNISIIKAKNVSAFQVPSNGLNPIKPTDKLDADVPIQSLGSSYAQDVLNDLTEADKSQILTIQGLEHGRMFCGLDYDCIFGEGSYEGHQAGYKQGSMAAYQWMISQIQEQMSGIVLEGPKIKQAVDALTPQVGNLE